MSDVRTYNNQHPSSGPFDPVAFGQLVAKFDPSLFYGINDPVTVQADGKAAAPAIIQLAVPPKSQRVTTSAIWWFRKP
jgi:filamentous hemagglutinin